MGLGAGLAFAQDAPKGFGEPDITVRVTTLEAQMKYDIDEFTVRPGSKVKLVLKNIDAMPHNLVIATPDEGDPLGMELAKKAWEMADVGFEKSWIPESARIIAHTGMVDPETEEAIYFAVPNAEGDYPFICTFPGHAMAMKGMMRVTTARADLFDLNYRLYEGTWDKLPDFDKLEPVSAGEVPSGKIDIGISKRGDHFAIRWVGKIEVKKAGEYVFRVASDDGSRLKVDGKVVVDNDGIHPVKPVDGKVRLEPGEHEVTVDYFEKGGEEELSVWWSGPGFKDRPLSSDAPKKAGGGGAPKGIPLVATDGEAILYRNFIEGAGARGIGVGYPGGVNLCFDADQMSVAMVWQGGFIDAKRHWEGRGQGFQPPLGYGILRSGGGQGVALLESAASSWPAAQKRAEGVRFLGYRLDEKRYPTFMYEVGGVRVADRSEPLGELSKGIVSLSRRVTFEPDGKIPDGLALRVATGEIKADGGASGRYWIGDAGRVTVEGAELRGKDLVVPVTGNEVEVVYDWGL